MFDNLISYSEKMWDNLQFNISSFIFPEKKTLVPKLIRCRNESRGLADSSVGKNSAWSARDPGLIPGSGRSAGEGIGYPCQ